LRQGYRIWHRALWTLPLLQWNDGDHIGRMSFYSNKQHYAYADVMWTPVKRITASLGYSGTFTGGDTLFLNPRILGGTWRSIIKNPLWLSQSIYTRV